MLVSSRPARAASARCSAPASKARLAGKYAHEQARTYRWLACSEGAISNGTIFAQDAAETPFDTAPDESAIAVWFGLVYFAYFFFFISGTFLIYDALGQEQRCFAPLVGGCQ